MRLYILFLIGLLAVSCTNITGGDAMIARKEYYSPYFSKTLNKHIGSYNDSVFCPSKIRTSDLVKKLYVEGLCFANNLYLIIAIDDDGQAYHLVTQRTKDLMSSTHKISEGKSYWFALHKVLSKLDTTKADSISASFMIKEGNIEMLFPSDTDYYVASNLAGLWISPITADDTIRVNNPNINRGKVVLPNIQVRETTQIRAASCNTCNEIELQHETIKKLKVADLWKINDFIFATLTDDSLRFSIVLEDTVPIKPMLRSSALDESDTVTVALHRRVYIDFSNPHISLDKHFEAPGILTDKRDLFISRPNIKQNYYITNILGKWVMPITSSDTIKRPLDI